MDTLQENEILALEAQIDKLLVLADNIKKADGMTKSFALEAETMIPGFNDGKPSAYYTVLPSFFEYKVSMEAISKTIWGGILTAVAAAALIIYKFYRWLFPKKSDKDTNAGDVVATAETVSKTVDSAPDVTKINTELNAAYMEDSVKKTKPFNSIDELINDYVKHVDDDNIVSVMLGERNPLIHDILNDGEYSATMSRAEANLQSVMHIVAGIDERLTMLLDAVKLIETTSPAHSKSLMQNAFDGIMGKLSTKTDAIKKIKFNASRSNIILAELAKDMVETRERVLGKTTSGNISFTKLNEKFIAGIKRSKINSLLNDIVKADKTLDMLNSNMEKVDQEIKKVKEVSDPELLELARALSSAFSEVRMDIFNCLSFIKEIVKYGKTVVTIKAHVKTVQMVALKAVEEEIRRNGNKVSTKFKELHKQLEAAFNI